MQEMIRILLADDHPIVREGLRAVLETQTDFKVIAEAASGDEALRLALALQPDILLLELEVLKLLAQGMPNKEIAAQLVISERTAKFHVSSIMGKLGATNRTEAVSLAAQNGLITLHS